MAMSLEIAYALASEIEWIHAKDRVRLLRSRGRGSGALTAAAEMEYDPLAATCLGDLIYDVANGASFRVRGGVLHQNGNGE